MRLIAMGQKALTNGFALLGFEAFPDANIESVEKILTELLATKESALVFLEHSLTNNTATTPAHTASALLQARREASQIIITEIPPLNAPDTYCPLVEELIQKVLGAQVLDSN